MGVRIKINSVSSDGGFSKIVYAVPIVIKIKVSLPSKVVIIDSSKVIYLKTLAGTDYK